MAQVTAEQLEMTFAGDQPALRQIDFCVASGEFVSLVGPSGCGKSTLLRLVAGLVRPSGGRILVSGHPPIEARQRWHRLAFVFQESNLLPWRSVAANIRLPLELERVPRARRGELIDQSLRLIGLTARDAEKRPHMLSGGMKMRVSLARALVTQPDLLLLDEPFAALDDLMRQQLNDELHRIWGERRFTALFVTHNVAEAAFLGQRILVMTPSPGTIAGQVEVPFPLPRSVELRAEPEFAQLCGRVSRLLRGARP